jgi:F-type H+-transporting ATPase subunit a
LDKIPEILKELSVEFLPRTEVGPVVGGFHLFSVSNYMVFMFITLFVTMAFFLVARSRSAAALARGATGVDLVPHGISNAAEALVDFVRNSICVDVMGEEGRKYFPFVGTLFFFVLFNNLIGLIPGFKAGTGTIGTTATWGVMVFIVYNAIGIRKNGPWGYLKSFVPSGVPLWLVPVMFPLEVLSHFIRPVTLAIRLFANLYAGHVVLGVFALFSALLLGPLFAGHLQFVSIVGVLTILVQILMYAFEIFVAAIQAYVFAILTAVYISGALHASEH